jgi:hypothetical protein
MNTAALLIALVCSVGFVAAETYTREKRETVEILRLSDELTTEMQKIAELQQMVQQSRVGLSASTDSASGIMSKVKSVDELVQRAADLQHELQSAKINTESKRDMMVQDTIADVAGTMDTFQTELEGLISEAVDDGDKLVQATLDNNDGIRKKLDAADDCAKKGQAYTGSACSNVDPEPMKTLPKIYYKKFNNDDSRDSGWLSNRWVNFKKVHGDESIVRVTYYDNMRVHGSTNCHAMWEVYFCDKNGNGCQQCSNPGRVNFWKYSHQHNNYWMNDHIGYTAVGYCRQAGNRKLEKGGEYRARVLLHNNRCDIHTGHNGQVGSLQVEEVRIKTV